MAHGALVSRVEHSWKLHDKVTSIRGLSHHIVLFLIILHHKYSIVGLLHGQLCTIYVHGSNILPCEQSKAMIFESCGIVHIHFHVCVINCFPFFSHCHINSSFFLYISNLEFSTWDFMFIDATWQLCEKPIFSYPTSICSSLWVLMVFCSWK